MMYRNLPVSVRFEVYCREKKIDFVFSLLPQMYIALSECWVQVGPKCKIQNVELQV